MVEYVRSLDLGSKLNSNKTRKSWKWLKLIFLPLLNIKYEKWRDCVTWFCIGSSKPIKVSGSVLIPKINSLPDNFSHSVYYLNCDYLQASSEHPEFLIHEEITMYVSLSIAFNIPWTLLFSDIGDCPFWVLKLLNTLRHLVNQAPMLQLYFFACIMSIDALLCVCCLLFRL